MADVGEVDRAGAGDLGHHAFEQPGGGLAQDLGADDGGDRRGDGEKPYDEDQAGWYCDRYLNSFLMVPLKSRAFSPFIMAIGPPRPIGPPPHPAASAALRAACGCSGCASCQFLLAQLRQGNASINFAIFHQFQVGAFADDPAFIQHDDLVGILDGGNALGDDQQGAGSRYAP